MNAMQITAEQERAMAEEYEDDDGLLATLLGPTVSRRGSRLEAQLEGAREKEVVCEAEEKKARIDMVSAKEEVRDGDEEQERRENLRLTLLSLSPPSVSPPSFLSLLPLPSLSLPFLLLLPLPPSSLPFPSLSPPFPLPLPSLSPLPPSPSLSIPVSPPPPSFLSLLLLSLLSLRYRAMSRRSIVT